MQKSKRKLIKKANDISKLLSNSAIFWKETVDDFGNTFCQCGLREETNDELENEVKRCKTDKHLNADIHNQNQKNNVHKGHCEKSIIVSINFTKNKNLF